MSVSRLVEHGEKQSLPGDPGLTELGRQQAARTGWWLRGLGVSAVWTSPMRRARETADCIAAATGPAVQSDARLRERLNWDDSISFEAFQAGIPPCAVTAIDNLNPVMIASVSHLT